MARMPITAEPSQMSAAELWARTRAMFACAIAAIGSLAGLAGFARLSPSHRRSTVCWVAILEHVVRKLLLAEATTFPATPALVAQRKNGEPVAHGDTSPRTSAIDISRPNMVGAILFFNSGR